MRAEEEEILSQNYHWSENPLMSSQPGITK